jgi:hypothetical protein
MSHRQEAPGALEAVRHFINTWAIPNDTRLATDYLPNLLTDGAAWAKAFPGYPRAGDDTLERLTAFRSDLRAALQPGADRAAHLNRWLAAAPAELRIAPGDESLMPVASAREGAGFVGGMMAIVTEALIQQHWARLRACEDCQWVFYDWTRNRSKKWCGMTKGDPDGRACGTIAKVRRFRERQREGNSDF